MLLIIGLGNPGKIYENSWHNLGFLVIEKLATKINLPPPKVNKKFKAKISQGEYLNKKIILAQPQTFMNNSGDSVILLTKFYKIKPEDIWIIHDDIDLPLGIIRISKNCSAAGHKGVLSVINSLKSQAMIRFRIGVNTDDSEKIATEKYVLQKPSKKLQKKFDEIVETVTKATLLALQKNIALAMNEFN